MGRFISELLDDIEEKPNAHFRKLTAKAKNDASLLVSEHPPTKNKKLLIYSAHDSTLVPIMCMLQHYDSKFGFLCVGFQSFTHIITAS